MNKPLRILLVLSIVFVVLVFLTLNSARGVYYACWLGLMLFFWNRRSFFEPILQGSPFGRGLTFIGLGILMILIEETLAGIAVNILQVTTLAELGPLIVQFYANNLLLLPGCIIAWYILLTNFSYSESEFFLLVGFFGLFAEKIYVHIVTIPVMGIALILPTMFTYMGILAPSYLSLHVIGTRRLPLFFRYGLGFLFPILVSVPFLLIHASLSKMGIIDPTVLTR